MLGFRLIIFLLLLSWCSAVLPSSFGLKKIESVEIGMRPYIEVNQKISESLFSKTGASLKVVDSSDERKLIYSEGGSEEVVYSGDSGRAMSGKFLTKVIIPNLGSDMRFILYETEFTSTGAGGLTTSYIDLYIAFLSPDGIKNLFLERVDSQLDELGLYDYNYDITYDVDNGYFYNPHIILKSSIETKLYRVVLSAKSVEKVSDDPHLIVNPSYDCTKSSNVIEYIICLNPGLSSLDMVLSDLYKVSSSDEKQKQLVWIKKRNGCDSYPIDAIENCLSNSYRSRISELLKQFSTH